MGPDMGLPAGKDAAHAETHPFSLPAQAPVGLLNFLCPGHWQETENPNCEPAQVASPTECPYALLGASAIDLSARCSWRLFSTAPPLLISSEVLYSA